MKYHDEGQLVQFKSNDCSQDRVLPKECSRLAVEKRYKKEDKKHAQHDPLPVFDEIVNVADFPRAIESGDISTPPTFTG